MADSFRIFENCFNVYNTFVSGDPFTVLFPSISKVWTVQRNIYTWKCRWFK